MVELIIWTIIKILFILFFVTLPLAGVLTVVDRRESSMIQDRIGPNRANLSGDVWDLSKRWRFLGLLHLLADGIKMIFKEDYSIKSGNRWIHTFAPILAFFPGLVILSIIPFGGNVTVFGSSTNLQIASFDSGMLLAFAFSSIAVYGITLAGWSSNNKFSLLGGVRATSQMLSYEVVLGLTLMGIFMIYGTLELNTIVQGQQSLKVDGTPDLLFGFLPKWGIFLQPFAMLLYVAAATAETKRAPFDVPEAESELVSGFFTEYGSMKMGMFLFAEYAEVVIFSMIFTTLFLGGYHVPYLYDSGFILPFGWGSLSINPTLVGFIQMLTFLLKVIIVAWGHLVIRWTLPRFRYDQVLRLGWKMLLPLALANIIITAIVLSFI
ncbi:NADH-quinone oxidoreductase subunit H [bacterium]|nr:NADH-quinone oxidoreductase subunit H [bacterium]